VVKRSKEYGKNVFSAPPSRWFRKTILYLFGGFGSVLSIAAILVFVSWKPLGQPPLLANLALGIVLSLVWLIQATFSFFQGKLTLKPLNFVIFKLTYYVDWSSSRVMASIKNMLPDSSNVIRSGTQMVISGHDIVPGDILSIKTGDKLPADIRIVQSSSDLKFDRAVLTGMLIFLEEYDEVLTL
jgi:sodium/potassium-transporting ATPase subunit alpha